MTAPTTGDSYIALYPCGCIAAAACISGDPDSQKRVGKHLEEWSRAGLRIERVTDEHVRTEFNSHCPHKPKNLFQESEAR